MLNRKKMLSLFYKLWRHKEREGERVCVCVGCGGGGGGGWTFMPVCQVFSICFGKKYNTGTFFRIRWVGGLACKVWVDSDTLENLTLNLTNTTVTRNHSITLLASHHLNSNWTQHDHNLRQGSLWEAGENPCNDPQPFYHEATFLPTHPSPIHSLYGGGGERQKHCHLHLLLSL